MSCQIPADCLNNIFEFLEEDKKHKNTLHSCLLVNRLWCEVSVGILWRNVWGGIRPSSRILSTLFACLPDESKELLHKNGIVVSTSTSKPPFFNYASFCRVLSIDKIYTVIEVFLSITPGNTRIGIKLITQEILKMFMKQISSLRKLTYRLDIWMFTPTDINFTHFPGA